MSTTAVDNKVKRVISNIRNLPTPPIVFHQIQKVINDPNVSAAQVAGILAEDPAMSVKVLKLTNSAFYGLSREVETVKHAVVIVGLEAIKNLVLSASVLDMFKGHSLDQDFQERFWRHSLSTGFAARILARKLQQRGMVDPDTAFSSGLLHDIGKLVMCCYLPDDYARFMVARKGDSEHLDCEIEESLLGYTHAEIGGYLATTWNLPQKLADAVTFHHYPSRGDMEDPITSIIHIANYLAKATFYDRPESHLVGSLDPEVVARMELNEASLESFADLLREEYAKAETFMQMVGLN